MKTKKLIIFGVEDYARIVYEYFTHDSDYEVCAFTVDREYLKDDKFMGLPLVAWDEAVDKYPPGEYEFHAAMVYGNMNRDRAARIEQAKYEKGYRLASYISSRAFVWHNANIGEHCFIMEDNTVQPFTRIGRNCILWSGNHIGHESRVCDNVFISSHVVISGWCLVGDNCFLGVNSTLANNTEIGRESWVGAGAIISGSIPAHSFVRGVTADISPLNEKALLRALERARK